MERACARIMRVRIAYPAQHSTAGHLNSIERGSSCWPTAGRPGRNYARACECPFVQRASPAGGIILQPLRFPGRPAWRPQPAQASTATAQGASRHPPPGEPAPGRTPQRWKGSPPAGHRGSSWRWRCHLNAERGSRAGPGSQPREPAQGPPGGCWPTAGRPLAGPFV